MAKDKKGKIKKREIRVKVDPALKRIKLSQITFKNTDLLVKYLSSRFKILPSTATGVSSKAQRKLQNEIKKARFLALLPYTDRHSLS